MSPLELRQVIEISAGHTLNTNDELGKIEQVKSDKGESPGNVGPPVAVHPAEHFRIPVVQSREECKAHTPEYDIVEMRHHKSGIMQLNVSSQRPKEQPGKPTDHKKKDKGDSVEQWWPHLN